MDHLAVADLEGLVETMILESVLTFFGGTAFRMIWGEVSAWLTAKQNHTQEIERMKLDGELSTAEHARNMEAAKLHAELGAKEIVLKSTADLDSKEMDAWSQAVSTAVDSKDSSIVGEWVKSIRPAAATVSLALWIGMLWRQGFVPSDWDRELIGAVLGFYFADRSLTKSGKA